MPPTCTSKSDGKPYRQGACGAILPVGTPGAGMACLAGDGPIGTSSLGFGPSSGGNFNFGFEGDVTDKETGLI